MRSIKYTMFLVCGMLLSLQVTGTDGYFSLGYGPYQKSLAGAGVSLYHCSLIGGNPAGNAFLDKSFAAGVTVFNPVRSFTVNGAPSGAMNSLGLMPGTVKSASEVFFIPAIGANWRVGEHSGLGAAIYANGGMSTDYPAKVFYGTESDRTGVNLAQLFAELTYAYELAPHHAFGLSAVLAYQQFEATGLNLFTVMSSAPDQVSDNTNETSFGFGFKVGYQGEIVNGLSLGVQFQSRMYMGALDKYAGLFAEHGDFDIPMALTAGLSYRFNDKWMVVADYKRIMYSSVKAVGNPMNPAALFPGFRDENGGFHENPNFVPMGMEEGAGFGWRDMDVAKFGVEFSGVPGWSFRAGYSYGKQPIPADEVLFNILAPGVVEHHVTLGTSRHIGSGSSELHLSFHYALNNTVTGVNPLDPVQTIDLDLKEFEFTIGVSF